MLQVDTNPPDDFKGYGDCEEGFVRYSLRPDGSLSKIAPASDSYIDKVACETFQNTVAYVGWNATHYSSKEKVETAIKITAKWVRFIKEEE